MVPQYGLVTPKHQGCKP